MERVNMYNNRNIRLINNVLALNRLFDVLENIVVDPVEIAIQRSLEEYELKKKDTNIEVQFYTYNTTDKKYDTCSICQEQYKDDSIVAILSCEHYFDKDCLETWGKYKPECPMCKLPIPTKESENNNISIAETTREINNEQINNEQNNNEQSNNEQSNEQDNQEHNFETTDNTNNIFTIEDFLYSYGMINSGIGLDNNENNLENNLEHNNGQIYTFASVYFYDNDEYRNNQEGENNESENSTTDDENNEDSEEDTDSN